MLTICTYLWGDKFDAGDVAKLLNGLRRHVSHPFKFVVITDIPYRRDLTEGRVLGIPESDLPLTKIKGCFARLRIFDPMFQENVGIVCHEKIDRIVCIDLDTIITGSIDPLFDRPEPFVIMQGANAVNPCPFNGALILLRAGAHPEVWSDFSLEAAAKVPFYSFPDDQGWIHSKIPHAAGWKVGPEHGIYVYQKPGWPGGKSETKLPDGARLVTFINKTPHDVAHLDWVKENWR